MPSYTASLRIGPQGRVVLPVALRRAAGLDEGVELVATVDGDGRVVLETPESVRARVWAGAPDVAFPPSTDDMRAMRIEDAAVSDAASARRSVASTTPDAGTALLDRLGL